MTVVIVSRVTAALRGTLTRWLIEVHPGVFVGTVSARVRERLWRMVQGRRRLGACTLITAAKNEQGFAIEAHGEARRRLVDFDGLQLLALSDEIGNKASIKARASAQAETTEKPSVEVCRGDPLVKGPDEAEKPDREVGHPECTVEPTDR